jgi:hypothetical protein
MKITCTRDQYRSTEPDVSSRVNWMFASMKETSGGG